MGIDAKLNDANVSNDFTKITKVLEARMILSTKTNSLDKHSVWVASCFKSICLVWIDIVLLPLLSS